jgi:dipeptidyl aminopeptidase/acylaminoacyl peptidase
VVALAPSVSAPLLQLHGTADGPARGEGGNEYHAIEQARKFEGALRQANKPYKAVHFDGSGHSSLFTDAKQYDETVQLVAKFLREHLRK